MDPRVKAALVRFSTLPGIRSALGQLLRGRAVIFMLHRFADPDRGVEGHDPQFLRQMLGYLRGERYELFQLEALFRQLTEGQRTVRRAVAFTIDDGYLEQATVGARVFAEFDCPVTTFVTTGFLDGATWFWWDKIRYVFDRTRLQSVSATLGSERLTYVLNSEVARDLACTDFTERCKRVPDSAKHEGIANLASHSEVEIPVEAPARYCPMSWEDLRRCENRGMTFGPHTVTHPILSQTTDEQSQYELRESWNRLCAEAATPTPIFCYPNGGVRDFGLREVRTLQSLSMLGAVTGRSGYAESSSLHEDAIGPFFVDRFSWPTTPADVMQSVTGLERLSKLLRNRS